MHQDSGLVEWIDFTLDVLTPTPVLVIVVSIPLFQNLSVYLFDFFCDHHVHLQVYRVEADCDVEHRERPESTPYRRLLRYSAPRSDSGSTA